MLESGVACVKVPSPLFVQTLWPPLQVRAAYLSEDGTEQIFWSRRPPGRAAGRGLFRRAA